MNILFTLYTGILLNLVQLKENISSGSYHSLGGKHIFFVLVAPNNKKQKYVTSALSDELYVDILCHM